jgi:hypothetical protein
MSIHLELPNEQARHLTAPCFIFEGATACGEDFPVGDLVGRRRPLVPEPRCQHQGATSESERECAHLYNRGMAHSRLWEHMHAYGMPDV